MTISDGATGYGWEGYAEASRAFMERVMRLGQLGGDEIARAALFAPWRDFAARMGMPRGPAPNDPRGAHNLFETFRPFLGQSREYQEIGQRLADLTLQFQQRYAEFLNQHVGVTRAAAQTVQGRLSDTALTESPAALYDAWIDAAESAYAQLAHTESFAVLFAELCNILSEFKIVQGRLLDRVARHLDLPGRAELDSLHHQVRELALAVRAQAAVQTRARAPARRVKKRSG